MSELNDFLKCHFENYGKCGKGKTNYLSHHIYDEFIDLMGEKIKNTIISEIKEAKYFSIILDSTPDISHTDQLTFIVRYINRDGVIQERFLGFLPIEEHKAKYIEETVIKELNVMSLDIKNCRGQTYDNAANMAGKYSGLQTRLRNYSPTAFVIPCANHSLKFNRKFCCRIMQ